MQKLTGAFALILVCAAIPKASAQETNPPPALAQTKLEALETNVDTVIVRATSLVGTVAANGGSLAVKCRDFTDAGTSRRELGISIDINGPNQRIDSLLLDFREVDLLLNAIDYLSRVNWSVTSFPAFDASFTTRSGFRLTAYGSRRTGAIEYSARSLRVDWQPMPLSLDQLSQLRSLVEQAKATLDGLRKAK